MSFLVELDVQGVTPEQGEAVEVACRERDAWPIEYGRGGLKRRLLRKPKRIEPNLWMPDGLGERGLISDRALWDEPFWDFEPEFRPKLAEAFRILGEFVPQGFTFRAAWVGDEVRHTKTLTADELADLAAASQINKYTLYVVPPADIARFSDSA